MDSNMLVVFGWKNERFEDTKEVIVNPKSKNDRRLANRTRTIVISKH